MQFHPKSFYVTSVVILVIVSVPQLAGAQTLQDAKDLRTALFTTNSYDKTVRPIADQSLAVDVSVSFFLLSVNSFDEVDEVLTTTGYLFVYWTDEQLTWTTTTYGDMYYAFWPQGDIWKPDIALKNSVQSYKPLGDDSLLTMVAFNGIVQWTPFQVFKSTCSMSITNYPFDVQTCRFEFVAWSYRQTEVLMTGGSSKGVGMQFYSENPSWDVIDTGWTLDTSTTESSIIFTITLKRKPQFVILTIILPVLLLSILSVFTFGLPGDKTGYAVTVFLSFAVFLTIVESSLPSNSESVPKISVYLILMTVMSTTISAITVLFWRMANWDERVISIPGWLKKLSRLINAFACNRCLRKRNKVDNESLKQNDNSKSVTSLSNDEQSKDQTADNEEECTWSSVVNSLDLVCFVIFFIYTFLANLLFLVLASSAE